MRCASSRRKQELPPPGAPSYLKCSFTAPYTYDRAIAKLAFLSISPSSQVLTGLALGGLGATCGAIVYFLHIEEVVSHCDLSCVNPTPLSYRLSMLKTCSLVFNTTDWCWRKTAALRC